MTQADLNRSLSRTTGESIRTIKQRGFSLFDPGAEQCEVDLLPAAPQVVDWDALELDRIVLAIQA